MYEQLQDQYELKFYIEPGTGIYRFDKFDNTGLFVLSCEDKYLNFYYVPDLGPAPQWARDLDS